MTQQNINLGAGPNTGDGDPLRTGGQKINANFTELYGAVNNANLQALAGLIGSADKLPYFTGIGVLSLSTLTSFSRTLLSLAAAADWKGSSGLDLVKADVGLGNVDNTSDANKPVSTAQAASIATKQDSNANLTAFSGLTGVADRLPYFTGAGALSLATLTSAARGLLDDADYPSMRTTIGLGGQSLLALNALAGVLNGVPYFSNTTTLATAVSTAYGRGLWNLADAAAGRTAFGLGTAALGTLTTSSSDVTAGRVLKVGDHGVGTDNTATGNAPTSTVLGDIPGNCFFSPEDASPSDFPSSLGMGVYPSGFSVKRSIGVSAQFVMTYGVAGTAGCAYRRRTGTNVWGPWNRVYSSDTIVGTVSQASGIPSGAIIERGTGANGEFTKFADGTLHCWYLVPQVSFTAGSDGTFTWTFPTSLISTATASILATVRSPASTNSYTVQKLAAVINTTGDATIRARFDATQNYTFSLLLIGRWY